MRRRSLAVLALTAILAAPAHARLLPIKDSRDGAFEATLVAIVSRVDGDTYKLDEVFLQPEKPNAAEALKAGDTINLPGFVLYSYDEWGWGGDRIEHAITDDTRILLFLKQKQGDAGAWEVAGSGYCFFWVDDASKADELRRIATSAVKLRTDWEKACAIEDAESRVGALWPFLWDAGWRCQQKTLEQFIKGGEVSGDYVAKRFSLLSHSERMSLLPSFGQFGGDKLHAVLRSHLEGLQRWYPSYATDSQPDSPLSDEERQSKARIAGEMSGELYYGTIGLAGFKRKDDLPFFRDLAAWAAEHRVKQTCDAALTAFRQMPAPENVPVIEAVWHEFTERPHKGNELSALDVAGCLRAHKYPETVPVLVKLLDDPQAGNEARAALTEIVGRDLGPGPDQWLRWYADHKDDERK